MQAAESDDSDESSFGPLRALKELSEGESDPYFTPYHRRTYHTPLAVMVHLFQIMTLDDWASVIRGVVHQSDANPWLLYAFFAVFIAVSALALMNLVTAVVVDTALRRTHEEEEIKKNVF